MSDLIPKTPLKHKVYYFNVNETAVAELHVSTQVPKPLSIEARRIDLKYNRGLNDAGFCEIEYYDTDDSQWRRMSGNSIDVYLLNAILMEPLFSGEDFVYYTTQMSTPTPQRAEMITIDGTDKTVGE